MCKYQISTIITLQLQYNCARYTQTPPAVGGKLKPSVCITETIFERFVFTSKANAIVAPRHRTFTGRNIIIHRLVHIILQIRRAITIIVTLFHFFFFNIFPVQVVIFPRPSGLRMTRLRYFIFCTQHAEYWPRSVRLSIFTLSVFMCNILIARLCARPNFDRVQYTIRAFTISSNLFLF